MNPPALSVKDLSYTYPDGTSALRGVAFDLEEGEKVALVGANGAGKSTLLMHLNGSLVPVGGAVVVKSLPLTSETVTTIRAQVGMVFQDPNDQMFMPTVHQDVAFGPLNANLAPEEVERLVSSALVRVGMMHVAQRPPYRLSAGEKRAVAIATVLSMEPDILVMDEPSTHLDPKARRRLINLLRELPQTLLIATHDLEMAVETCSRVLVMDGGRIVADGLTTDVLNDSVLMERHGLERPHILSHRHPH